MVALTDARACLHVLHKVLVGRHELQAVELFRGVEVVEAVLGAGREDLPEQSMHERARGMGESWGEARRGASVRVVSMMCVCVYGVCVCVCVCVCSTHDDVPGGHARVHPVAASIPLARQDEEELVGQGVDVDRGSVARLENLNAEREGQVELWKGRGRWGGGRMR